MTDLNDPTNGIGNDTNGFVIHFVHVPTRQTCHFKAMLTSWDDSFKQDWSSYETVGRMDPIRTYKRTSRTITFSLEIPSFDVKEAAHNFEEIEKLIQMSYPTFNTQTTTGQVASSQSPANSEASAKVKNAKASTTLNPQTGNNSVKTVSHMVSPPFFRIKFANWLNNPAEDFEMKTNEAVESGLYGTIENIKFSPDFSNGFYGPKELYHPVKNDAQEKTLIPSLMKLDIVFNVLHTNELGYSSTTFEPRTLAYPYNASRINNKVKVRVK